MLSISPWKFPKQGNSREGELCPGPKFPSWEGVALTSDSRGRLNFVTSQSNQEKSFDPFWFQLMVLFLSSRRLGDPLTPLIVVSSLRPILSAPIVSSCRSDDTNKKGRERIERKKLTIDFFFFFSLSLSSSYI